MTRSIAFESEGILLDMEVRAPRDGVMLLFCHGFPGNNLQSNLLALLREQGHGTAVVPYRGAHGNPGGYSFRGNEADIRNATRAAREQKLTGRGLALVGYSLGGYHSMRIAALDDEVDALVLLAPLVSMQMTRDAWGDLQWEAFLSDNAGILVGDPKSRLAEAHDVTAADEGIALAPSIRAPVLLAHGTRDEAIPIAHGRALAAVLPQGATFVELDDAHSLDASSERLSREIHAFLQGIEARVRQV